MRASSKTFVFLFSFLLLASLANATEIGLKDVASHCSPESTVVQDGTITCDVAVKILSPGSGLVEFCIGPAQSQLQSIFQFAIQVNPANKVGRCDVKEEQFCNAQYITAAASDVGTTYVMRFTLKAPNPNTKTVTGSSIWNGYGANYDVFKLAVNQCCNLGECHPLASPWSYSWRQLEISHYIITQGNDQDGDGVIDSADACPTIAGTGPDGCAPKLWQVCKNSQGTLSCQSATPDQNIFSVIVPDTYARICQLKNLVQAEPQSSGAGPAYLTSDKCAQALDLVKSGQTTLVNKWFKCTDDSCEQTSIPSTADFAFPCTAKGKTDTQQSFNSAEDCVASHYGECTTGQAKTCDKDGMIASCLYGKWSVTGTCKQNASGLACGEKLPGDCESTRGEGSPDTRCASGWCISLKSAVATPQAYCALNGWTWTKVQENKELLASATGVDVETIGKISTTLAIAPTSDDIQKVVKQLCTYTPEQASNATKNLTISGKTDITGEKLESICDVGQQGKCACQLSRTSTYLNCRVNERCNTLTSNGASDVAVIGHSTGLIKLFSQGLGLIGIGATVNDLSSALKGQYYCYNVASDKPAIPCLESAECTTVDEVDENGEITQPYNACSNHRCQRASQFDFTKWSLDLEKALNLPAGTGGIALAGIGLVGVLILVKVLGK